MIKALVVDDEKRVRRGFIALADWSACGIQIVGEAKDGLSAMEQLAVQEIDLMFVDISMPGMTGFELIEQAREKYPWTKSVILTCHHEFDYVQEALRLGAIDYIVKTLLSKHNVDETMQRIVKRFVWERKGPEAGTGRNFASAVVFSPLHRETPLCLPQGIWTGHKMKRLDDQLAMVYLTDTDATEWIRELPTHVTADWQPAYVVATGELEVSQKEAEALIRQNLSAYLFYRNASAQPMSAIPLSLLKPESRPLDADIDKAFEDWKQFKWLIFGDDWKGFIERIEAWRIPPERLRDWLKEISREGAAYLGWKTEDTQEGGLVAEIDGLRNWLACKSWLSRAALITQQRLMELSLSREVFASLIRAVYYMKQHAGQDLNQDEVARRIGMSRSYFSQCFKKFAGGELFGDTLRKIRIEAAQTLLLQTDLSVRRIANNVGFEDEKYFSRVFRDKVGYLPTEFRNTQGGGG